ncbi:MAG: hypothetical protein JW932_17180 [Deltaproteobacteria bacterium]|nr:hypothetical protein [Deltaproteobacteria bacterium]
MTYWSFEDTNLKIVSDALHIAEDKTGDFYKFSFSQWKRHRYDVKTQTFLADDEISSFAFALLNKCTTPFEGIDQEKAGKDFYIICLQDHQILKALKRDTSLNLLSLLVYIFTHELIHIVRFCNFYQRFDISGKEKESEERIVHETTYRILKELSLPRLDYILESYQPHRICDLGIQ